MGNGVRKYGRVSQGYVSLRTPENAKMICERIVEGLTMRQIAAELECDWGAIFQWINADKEFGAQYFIAKMLQADSMAEELIEIADDGSNDWQVRENEAGRKEIAVDKEHIMRSRLRVDTRKWLMASYNPRKYAARLAIEQTKAPDVTALTDAELADIAGRGRDGIAPPAERPSDPSKLH